MISERDTLYVVMTGEWSVWLVSCCAGHERRWTTGRGGQLAISWLVSAAVPWSRLRLLRSISCQSNWSTLISTERRHALHCPYYISLHHCNAQRQPVATDVARSVVCVSVCLYKNGLTDRDAVWWLTQVGPKNHILDGNTDHPPEWSLLTGHVRDHRNVAIRLST